MTGFDRLGLADWRRRIRDLYSDVRRIARDDPRTAWGHWVATREALFRDHPQSPVSPGSRAGFRALHWPYDPAVRFEVPVVPAPPVAPGALPLELPNSGSDVLAFSRIGAVEIPFAAGSRRLSVFWMAGYSGGLFLPFRDATNGTETYGAGRYLLDGAKSADLGGDPDRGTLILDFNFAFHPSCAFDPKWACPLAPPENRLDFAIRAGERIA
ncbi:MAG: DUF1684 domain-containing protein [Chloroflexota bacterium]|nr:DUF1684 domain-containing protein [Chloroflexota bacterium]